jgi:Amt family ammonium transporter
VLLMGVTPDSIAATFSKGVGISEFIYVVFQGAFAAITCGLIVGGFAERMKFSAVLLFAVIWFTFAYIPMAHMVWYWAGPDAYTDAAAAEAAGATAGYLFQHGALDFAGGTVVHINAAVAGLVGAFMVGKRVGYGRDPPPQPDHDHDRCRPAVVRLVRLQRRLLPRSQRHGGPGLRQHLDRAGRCRLSWTFAEWAMKGRPSLLGAVSGAVAGLVAITPAAGFVGVGAPSSSACSAVWPVCGACTVSSVCWGPMTAWTCSACTGCAGSWVPC